MAGSHSACVALFMSDRPINGEVVEVRGVVLAGGVRGGGVEAALLVVASAAEWDGVAGRRRARRWCLRYVRTRCVVAVTSGAELPRALESVWW